MDMLGIISRSEIMRSKFRNALRLLIGCGFALFLKKMAASVFKSGISVVEERRVVFVVVVAVLSSQNHLPGERNVCTGFWGPALALFPHSPCISV